MTDLRQARDAAREIAAAALGRDPGPIATAASSSHHVTSARMSSVDDWFFLARFSGPHTQTVLDVIARATGTSLETLRAECEVRDATYLACDLRLALEHSGFAAGIAADRLAGLEQLIAGRYWWRETT